MPLLNERQRTFLSMPRAERVAACSNEAFRADTAGTFVEGGKRPLRTRIVAELFDHPFFTATVGR